MNPSLLLPSAKVWFGRKVDRAPASFCEGELDCARWIESRTKNPNSILDSLSSNDFDLTMQQIEYSLCKGRTMPTTGSLDIKGAFVTDNLDEYVTLNKRTRALQIHLLGWT